MNFALIVAAGSSRRMGFNKLLAPLQGRPVIWHSVSKFQNCPEIAGIVLVGGEDVLEVAKNWREESEFPKLISLLPGGAERHHSVQNGLNALPSETKLVAVHDGARPLIAMEQITKCLQMAALTGAAACAHRVVDTLKRAETDGRVIGSVDREGLWAMETPQVFSVDLLLKAYEAVKERQALITDEVSALQLAGMEVRLIENQWPNPKITVPADLALAEALISLGQTFSKFPRT